MNPETAMHFDELALGEETLDGVTWFLLLEMSFLRIPSTNFHSAYAWNSCHSFAIFDRSPSQVIH
jgi:hypothetical protein